MDLINCRSCGKLFKYVGGSEICPTCALVFEERFQLVKEYIYDHPLVGAQQVAKEFDISVNTIYRWVREERLEFSKESAFGLPCECCGEKIRTGKYCETCKHKLQKGLSDVYKTKPVNVEKKKSPDNPRMRFPSYGAES